MPSAGKRDSKAMLEFQMTFGISSPDRNALFAARNDRSSNAIIRAAAIRLQRFIADPITKMRTIASTLKKRTNEMTPTIHFFSLLSIAWREAGDASCKCRTGLVILCSLPAAADGFEAAICIIEPQGCQWHSQNN